MTIGKVLAVAICVAGLLFSLSTGANAAAMRAPQTTIQTATGFLRLPPPPPIVGYPPQIYMNMLPPGVVGPSFGPGVGSNFGLGMPVHRHDFHRFDRAFEFENPHEQ